MLFQLRNVAQSKIILPKFIILLETSANEISLYNNHLQVRTKLTGVLSGLISTGALIGFQEGSSILKRNCKVVQPLPQNLGKKINVFCAIIVENQSRLYTMIASFFGVKIVPFIETILQKFINYRSASMNPAWVSLHYWI